METIFRTRYVSVIAVIFGAIGAVLMFVIGAVTTVDSVVTYFGGHEDAAFSSDAALAATVEVVSALDQFLLGLVLLVFAFGVYSLWIMPETAEGGSSIKPPSWIKVTSVTDLKLQLIEVVAVLLAVLFLKGVLSQPETVWSDLVVPIAVVLFALTYGSSVERDTDHSIGWPSPAIRLVLPVHLRAKTVALVGIPRNSSEPLRR